MKMNTKVRYGLRTAIELASKKPGEDIYQKDISMNQEISYKYLDQIIAGLRSAGLVTTVSGKKSGYILAREPGNISVYDIFTAFNPGLAVVECLSDEVICKREGKCAAKYFWEELNDVVEKHLKSVTIKDLLMKQVEINKQLAE